MTDAELSALAQRLGERLQRRGLKIVTAESCTGGWLAKALTDNPGSSAWFERGYVTYSNTAKTELLGVDPATIERHGAVSEAVVLEMARGAIAHSHAEVAAAVSGVAGPDGGTPAKPVGTVWCGFIWPGRAALAEGIHLTGDREGIRRAAVRVALQRLLALADQADDPHR